ncbi:hypothetical protein [Ponticoccus alexandrii]|uniref:hypothetical protein n=1 Tax=Ponticoccus alexandrii TaxID=1943633 RepID=UPI0012E0A247|nr:hypothetical protein [Ponticoccus alexandrii]
MAPISHSTLASMIRCSIVLEILREAGVPFDPGKAAHAWGVATLAPQIQRNASRDR